MGNDDMVITPKYKTSLKTGSSLKYPVVMKAPFDYTEYVLQFEIKTDDVIAIGDIAAVELSDLLIVSTSVATAAVIVMDTAHNKSILEGHGLTVNKTSQFKDGDVIDCLLLVPGLILSMKVQPKADIIIGQKLIANDTAGELTNGVTAGSVIGMALTRMDWTAETSTHYTAVLVK